MTIVEKMKEAMESVESNSKLFMEKGNQAAGTRARKSAMVLKVLSHDLRIAIQNKKNEG